MTKLEGLIRRSLSRGDAGQNAAHVTEDRLAAFAENVLGPREREGILSHLAQCTECREQFYLFVGEFPPAKAVLDHRWKTFLWGPSIAFATFAIAFLIPRDLPERPREGIYPPRRSAEVRPFVPPVPKPEPIPTRAVKLVPPPPILNTAHPLFDPLRFPLRLEVHRWTNQIPRNEDSRAKMLNAGGAPPATADIIVKNGFLPGMSPANARAVNADFSRLQNVTIVWRLSDANATLERSQNDGRNWMPVPIDDSVRFLSVASSGAFVWAGGTDGSQAVLYISADAGQQWKRLAVPFASGIRAIDATSNPRLEIDTTSGERWRTLDAGRNWIKVY